jgi:hypothetical protein
MAELDLTKAEKAQRRAILNSRIFFDDLVGWALKVVQWTFFALGTLTIVSFVLQHFKDIQKFALYKIVEADNVIEAPALEFVRANLPTNFNGKDVSWWVYFLGIYFISVMSGVLGAGFRGKANLLRRERDSSENDSLLKKAAALKGGKLDRTQLLELYAEAKKSLDLQRRHLAFLSIDVVDSTGMKVGEEVSVAENDFRSYKHFVERILRVNHAMKSAWTPDGVMICFANTGQAIRAAQAVIVGLAEFNRKTKAIKRNFSIRAGINAGNVFCDDHTPMEEMTDRVIDIAGHMQKHGIVDGIAISKMALDPYMREFSFIDANRVVDECPVYEWTLAAGLDGPGKKA